MLTSTHTMLQYTSLSGAGACVLHPAITFFGMAALGQKGGEEGERKPVHRTNEKTHGLRWHRGES
eukprot:3623059-Pleurochrysis_carterae.AAC.2